MAFRRRNAAQGFLLLTQQEKQCVSCRLYSTRFVNAGQEWFGLSGVELLQRVRSDLGEIAPNLDYHKK